MLAIENGLKVHKITKLRIGEIKNRRYEEFVMRCAQINSDAEKARRFRTNIHSGMLIEASYNYVSDLFNDILLIERNALKERILFFGQKKYFDQVISEMSQLLLQEFRKVLDEQFGSTSSAYEAGIYQNPLTDSTIQKTIEGYSERIHRLVVDTVNSMMEEFKQSRNKRILMILPKMVSIFKDIQKSL